jgi:hypothetical protein
MIFNPKGKQDFVALSEAIEGIIKKRVHTRGRILQVGGQNRILMRVNLALGTLKCVMNMGDILLSTWGKILP